LTSIAYALGGVLGCSMAASIELYQGTRKTTMIDPNVYFAIYALLIFGLFISVI
jgi:hypothetical protein